MKMHSARNLAVCLSLTTIAMVTGLEQDWEALKPGFHFAPSVHAKINDPHAMVEIDGVTHLWFQQRGDGGSVQWGHAKSEDTLRWTDLPVSIVGDSHFDAAHAFSGSSQLTNDGRSVRVTLTNTAQMGSPAEYVGPLLQMFYTGLQRGPEPLPNHEWFESQLAAFSFGEDFLNVAKYPLPLATNRELMRGLAKSGYNISRKDVTGFRDPFVYFDPVSATWKMAVGSGIRGHAGLVVLFECTPYPKSSFQFRSANDPNTLVIIESVNGEALNLLIEWEFVAVLDWSETVPGHDMAHNVECPQIMTDSDRAALIFSDDSHPVTTPHAIGKNQLVRYVVAESDEPIGPDSRFHEAKVFDGPLFYAASLAKNGDLFGWIREDRSDDTMYHSKWFGVHSVPRQLTLKDGQLFAQPIDGLHDLRSQLIRSTSTATVSDTTLDECLAKRNLLRSDTGDRMFDITLDIGDAEKKANGIVQFCFFADENFTEETCLQINLTEQTITIERSHSTQAPAGINTEKQVVSVAEPISDLRVLLDRSVVELFANGGSTLFTTRVYPTLTDSLHFSLPIICVGEGVGHAASVTTTIHQIIV